MTEYRIEHDTMGEVQVPKDALWRAQTQRAVENFPISGRGLESAQIRAMGLLKAACAHGKYDAEVPIDVYQSGSGTCSNVNANEVLAPLDKQNGVELHPNDHVKMGQSANDTFPSATRVAATEAAGNDLSPGLKVLHESLL